MSDYKERSGEILCECGQWSGERCSWHGPVADTVVVEFMPQHTRASHVAAGNCGTYPSNGSVLIRAERTCADRMVETDGEWCKILPTKILSLLATPPRPQG